MGSREATVKGMTEGCFRLLVLQICCFIPLRVLNLLNQEFVFAEFGSHLVKV